MTSRHKHEFELLQAAARETYERSKAKWIRLLRALHLSQTYVPAIQEIFRQGKWRSHKAPMAYVRKAAVKWALQHGLVEIRRKAIRGEPAPETNLEIVKQGALNDEHKLVFELCQLQIEDEQNLRDVAELLAPGITSEHGEVNWEKVALLANLDSGERLVLDLKLMGLSWRDAIAACLTHEDRAILNTAWRRFDRHKDLVKKVLLTGEAQHIRRTASVPELELMFTQGEDERLKIFFKKIPRR